MHGSRLRGPRRRAAAAALLASACLLAGAAVTAQRVSTKETALNVEVALARLPSYGVFDYLVYSVERGVVTIGGFAYRPDLQKEAASAIEQVAGVDEVAFKIETLPASQNDDRIRWSTFYNIYTDDFLSRYSPGGAMHAREEVLSLARFPGMQPSGSYPIHIIVRNGRTALFGVVDSEADKTIAGVRARDVPGVFGVDNRLEVDKR